MGDFNENAEIIDSALAELAGGGKAVCGSFTITNSVSKVIELGFKPKMPVLIGPFNGTLLAFGLVMDGMAIYIKSDSSYAGMGDCSAALQLTDTGIYIQNGYAFNWGSGYTTFYAAIP